MKIAFVGGGAATLIAANLLIKKHPDYKIIIIDKKAKLGRKLSMTGNGKCNLAPINDNIDAYNNPSFIEELFSDISLKQYLKTLEDLGIPTKTIKNQGYYPLSENASNVVDILINQLKNKVSIINDEVIDYENTILRLKNNGTLTADKIIFAIGGKSYPNSGSDGNLFPILEKHGYQINELKPSLCPIKVKENIKSLFGARNHAKMTLINKESQVIYEEEGEIMFKKDALSGIAIMNMSHFISHKPGPYHIKVDFLNDRAFSYLNSLSPLDNLLRYVNKPIAEYILKIAGEDSKNPLKLSGYLSDLTFHVDTLYDFESAQVTAGGISIKEIDNTFMSIREPNIYLIGEMLDIDGLCGGYNLRFAISSAIKMVESL